MRTLKISSLLFGLTVLISTVSSFAQSVKVKLLTANETGTYHKMGQDLKSALLPEIDIELIPSLGSLTNVLTIAVNPDIHLGFAQIDVLNSPLIKDKVQLALPLYEEEVHLLATKSIKHLADLYTKKVSLGVNGSGTFSAATALLKALEIDNIEKVYLEIEDSLTALAQGDIDALFYVIGYPAPLLEKQVTVNDKLHLVPVKGKFDNTFSPTVIPPQTYPWQQQAIETVSVLSVLASHAYHSDDPRCEAVGQVINAIYKKMDVLKKKGHDKWDKVKFDPQVLAEDKTISACTLKSFSE
ncbi:MAG: TAXI family TRAP transporter solute-binding subunit [Pseudomonadota bacterium]|nr:TAXI family TRAP transporter solute-binding subunit [Pseudomonadota bacterium]